MDRHHQQTVQELSQLSRGEVEREYVQVESYQKQAAQGQSPELKQFASQAFPTLSDHSKMAEEITQQVMASK